MESSTNPTPAAPASPEPQQTQADQPQISLTPEDFYREGEYIVFTAAYHLKRGYCCNSGCRHCPYH